MKESYLEVTFRHGRPIAAYLYLPRRPDEKSTRTLRVAPGMVIDFGSSGNPIGVEITAPSQTSLADVNRVLVEVGMSPISQADLAPLQAA